VSIVEPVIMQEKIGLISEFELSTVVKFLGKAYKRR
jgi:hypothetical protein